MDGDGLAFVEVWCKRAHDSVDAGAFGAGRERGSCIAVINEALFEVVLAIKDVRIRRKDGRDHGKVERHDDR